jgi:hypothetical protein
MFQSGQVTVATAGTAVQGPDVPGPVFAIKAHPSNTGQLWVGNSGQDVSSTTGYPLAPGEQVLVRGVNLKNVWFDVDTSTEKATWIVVA